MSFAQLFALLAVEFAGLRTLTPGYETVHEKFSALRMIVQDYVKSLILLAYYR